MKKNIARITAFGLCLSLLLSTFAYAAFPTTLLKGASTALAQGVTLSTNILWKDSASDKVTENYVTYTPNQAITPLVVYGSKVCNYGNFIDMAELLEKRGYSVIAGINGDYYNTDTYQPLGIVITDGKLKSSDAGLNAVGFKADGTAIMGSPALNMSFTVGGTSYPLYGINKTRDNQGFYLFTEDFSYTTKSSGGSTDIILSIVKGDLTLNTPTTLKVDSINKSTGAMELPAGKMVLSISNTAYWQDVLKSIAVGSTITVNVNCADTRWNNVQFAVGSLYKLITAGKLESGLETGTNAPRTAIGSKPNGEIILYTVDGRQSGYSVGASIQDVAERLLALGCTEACLMDGGGSTTIGAKMVGDSDYTLINSPSDGSMRYVSEFIMLAAKGYSTPSFMGVYPYDALMFEGAQRTFTAGTADKFGNAKPTGTIAWSVKSGTGAISPSGVYTAGSAGQTVISASSGGISATTNITVLSAPDTLAVKNESTGSSVSSILLEAGQSISLTASAVYKQMALQTADTDFKWTISDGLGTVDSGGTLIAGLKAGSGTLTVSAGSKQVSIPVTVETGITKLEDFEGSSLNLSGTPKNATAALNTNIERVRFGRQSADIKYNLGSGSATVPINLTVTKATPYMSMWVYGDSSGNSIKMTTGSGTVDVASLDFTGWKQLIFPVSANITGIQISGSGSGEIWLDHITGLSSSVTDTTGPHIELSGITGALLKGGIWDDNDGSISYKDVAVYVDGKSNAFDYQSGMLQSNLPSLDAAYDHRITIYAADASGNRSRYTLSLPATAPTSKLFADTSGYWAENYINYLSARGIVSGISSGDKLYYQPGDNMTREQFAVVMARYLGTDLTKYKDIKLDFPDTDSISDYALPSVKAMYALGIIKGVTDGDKVYFMPKSSVTRAQAMTIIGRTMPAGYKEAELNFPDAGLIPDWSAHYVGVLTGLGIVGGREDGSLQPSASVTRAEVAKIITMLY